jgi:hypothetical protein
MRSTMTAGVGTKPFVTGRRRQVEVCEAARTNTEDRAEAELDAMISGGNRSRDTAGPRALALSAY